MFAWTQPDEPLLRQQEQVMNKLLRKQGISLAISVFLTFFCVVIVDKEQLEIIDKEQKGRTCLDS